MGLDAPAALPRLTQSPRRISGASAYGVGASSRARARRRGCADGDSTTEVAADSAGEDLAAKAATQVRNELALWDRNLFDFDDEPDSRQDVEEMKLEWDHLRYIRYVGVRFPDIAEELASLYVSNAELESVFSHAGRVDSLRRTRFAPETLEVMTAAIVQSGDFDPHFEKAVRYWALCTSGWDEGLPLDSEATVLDDLNLDEVNGPEEEINADPLARMPLIDDVIPPDEEQFGLDAIRGEDDAFPPLRSLCP